LCDQTLSTLGVEFVELFFVVDHAGVLFGADRAPVERVKNQDYRLLAAVVAEFHFFLILIF
jgi:hypothetical protein